MRFLQLSDLHIEFEKDVDRAWMSGCEPPDPDSYDAVLLCGDIHNCGYAVLWARRTFQKPVFQILGNHEYYGGEFTETLYRMRALAHGTNVRILENEAAEINGVRILGTTLWTDFNLYQDRENFSGFAQTHIRDYEYIRSADRLLLPRDTWVAHAKARRWLESELAKPYPGKTVVMTHHLPSESCIPPNWIGDYKTPAYASNMNELIGSDIAPDYWFFGHTHASQDRVLGRTRFICNPRGYSNQSPPSINPGFNPCNIVEI